MSKKLVLQVYVKLDDHTGHKRFTPVEDIYKLSEQQARKFAKKWDADYHQITDTNYLPDKHPCFQRLKMYEMLEYDQILYLDMDAIVLPNCPNIFEFYSDHTFSAVRDAPWDKDQHFEEKRQLFNKVYGAKSDYRPFCSGVVLATKKFLEDTKDMWRQYINSFDSSSNGISGGHDQAILNKLVVEKYDGKYNELDEKWGPWYRNGKYIEHIGGPFGKKMFDLNKFSHKFGVTLEEKIENSLTEFM